MKSSALEQILAHLKQNPENSNVDFFVPHLWTKNA